MKLSDQLRRAIDDSGTTRYAIANKLGINHGTLSQFMHGRRGLRLETVDQLCELLKLQLVTRGSVRRKAR